MLSTVGYLYRDPEAGREVAVLLLHIIPQEARFTLVEYQQQEPTVYSSYQPLITTFKTSEGTMND